MIVKDVKSGDYAVECLECDALVARMPSYALLFNSEGKEEAHAHPTE